MFAVQSAVRSRGTAASPKRFLFCPSAAMVAASDSCWPSVRGQRDESGSGCMNILFLPTESPSKVSNVSPRHFRHFLRELPMTGSTLSMVMTSGSFCRGDRLVSDLDLAAQLNDQGMKLQDDGD